MRQDHPVLPGCPLGGRCGSNFKPSHCGAGGQLHEGLLTGAADAAVVGGGHQECCLGEVKKMKECEKMKNVKLDKVYLRTNLSLLFY